MTAPEALDPEPLLRFLPERGVVHIIIGGVAVAAHGYARPTTHLDIVASADRENLTRLAARARAHVHAVVARHRHPSVGNETCWLVAVDLDGPT